MTCEGFNRHALGVLERELAADGLAQFVRLSRSSGGDYTHDCEEWQAGLTIDDVLDSVRRHR